MHLQPLRKLLDMVRAKDVLRHRCNLNTRLKLAVTESGRVESSHLLDFVHEDGV